ncbi:hypothetical protein I6E12_03485 [Prevotella brevis]|uniref:Uracil-DNA glycosylase-like domain-containing protein n=4 Tax=Prevotellaceae TaxID=171552 RepID=A0ABS9CDX0_9BACT|nr:hypothetical protein [Xylanibacter brevis]MCF2563173.1 hypothetical protein [Xylanibacter brevis]
MNNEQNNIQAKLEKWAEDTVKAYHQIATRDDVNIAYYTQSDLSLLSEEPELMIVGINPGNPYGITPYTEQCKNKNWSYLYNNPLDKNHLWKGNYCKEEGKTSSWDNHKKWKYWAGLKSCLSQTALSTVINDDSKIIVTNASFFSTEKADGISESLLTETIPYTLDLIHITTPNNIIFLSGKKCFERLCRLSKSSQLFQFEYKHICGNIFVGILNKKYCIGIPHPAYKTNEEIKLVASVLPSLLKVSNYENIDVELIRKRCAKQIKEYEDRIYNHKKSNNKQVKISNIKSIVQQVTSSINLIAYQEKNHRYKIDEKYGITITDSQGGYLGIRHIIYDSKDYKNIQDNEVLALKKILRERGYKTTEKAWIGTKSFNELGMNEDEIVTNIVSEINEIVEFVRKNNQYGTNDSARK